MAKEFDLGWHVEIIEGNTVIAYVPPLTENGVSKERAARIKHEYDITPLKGGKSRRARAVYRPQR